MSGARSRQGTVFVFAVAFIPALAPTESRVLWTKGDLSVGVERQEHELNHSSLFFVAVTKLNASRSQQNRCNTNSGAQVNKDSSELAA
jgi:hypothetical protein